MNLEAIITDDHTVVTRRINGQTEVKVTSLEGLLSCLAKRSKFDSGYLDQNIIRLVRIGNKVYALAHDTSRIRQVSHQGGHRFTIPTPPSLFLFIFKEEENGRFHLSGSRVAAVTDAVVSDASTLFRFPFGNVYDDSRICWGNALHAARYRLDSGATDLISSFWAASFNNHLDGLGGFSTLTRFQELDGQEVFPITMLTNHRTYSTVGEMVNHVTGGNND